MAKYLLVESRAPWDSEDVTCFSGLATGLATAGHEVCVYLVQNGVMAARQGAKDGGLSDLAGRVRVLADDFSLRERAIDAADLIAGVRPAGIEELVDLVAQGARAAWH